MRFSAEVRGNWAVVSITDEQRMYTSEIVCVRKTTADGAGLMHTGDGTMQSFTNFELRNDTRGVYRGEMRGSKPEIYNAEVARPMTMTSTGSGDCRPHARDTRTPATTGTLITSSTSITCAGRGGTNQLTAPNNRHLGSHFVWLSLGFLIQPDE